MTRVALTIGDPRGIGPELVSHITKDPPPGAELIVVGPGRFLTEFGPDCQTVEIDAE